MTRDSEWNARIVVDPDVSAGLERSVQGTGIGISSILHARSYMTSESQVADYFSKLVVSGAERSVTVEDIRACCLFASDLARRRFLSAPAASRFRRDQDLDDEGVRHVGIWAPDILEHFGHAKGEPALMTEVPDADEAMIHRAFAYAASLVSEELLPVSLERSLITHEPWDQLSGADLRRIVEFCIFHRSLGLKLLVPTPQDWFQLWSKLVERVEAGYDSSLDELTNELTARDLLEDAMLLLAPPSQPPIRHAVDPWDFRFLTATMHSDVSLMGSQARWEPRRWWWLRIPTAYGPTLDNDLRARGIVRTDA